MIDRNKVIEGLELCLKGLSEVCPYKDSDAPGGCKDELMFDALMLLGTKEPKLEEIADKYGLTYDGVDFALGQYQRLICEITKGRLSKLTYSADLIVDLVRDMENDTHEPQDYKHPAIAVMNRMPDGTVTFTCSICGSDLNQNDDTYCQVCGHKVVY